MSLQTHNFTNKSQANSQENDLLFFDEEKVSKLENIVISNDYQHSAEFSTDSTNNTKTITSSKKRQNEFSTNDFPSQKKIRNTKNTFDEIVKEDDDSISTNKDDQMNLDFIEKSGNKITTNSKTKNEQTTIINSNNDRCTSFFNYFERFKKYEYVINKDIFLFFINQNKLNKVVSTVPIQKTINIYKQNPKNIKKLNIKIKILQFINRGGKCYVKALFSEYFAMKNGDIINSKKRNVKGITKAGYLRVVFYGINMYINRIIAAAFGILNEFNCDSDVDHIDRNQTKNNSLSNLQVLNKKQHAKKTSIDNPNNGKHLFFLNIATLLKI